MTTRAEHLQWCKDRALEYCEEGDCRAAIASMMSDLDKHDDTRGHAGNQIAVIYLLAGQLDTVEDCKKFINGYN